MPSTLAAKLKERLKELRRAHGLTQEDFAELSGITYKYYQKIEQGGKCDLRTSTLERLAKAYGVEVWELLAPAIPATKVVRKARGTKQPKGSAGK